MSAAAYTLPVDRQGDWLRELGRIFEDWDAMTPAARDAVDRVVDAFLASPETSEEDVAAIHALIARSGRRLLRSA